MPILDIKIFPDPVLREKSKPVTEFNTELHRFLDSLTETMYEAGGVGLAAPQVGVLKRVAVIDITKEGTEPIEFINPVITVRNGSIPSEEGCLSIPGYREKIKRNLTVTVEAMNRKGEQFAVNAEDLLAICLQHEIDHLDGVLFIDHLSRLKRTLFKQWLKRQMISDLEQK